MDFSVILLILLGALLLWGVYAMFMRPPKKPAGKPSGSDQYLGVAGTHLSAAGGWTESARHHGHDGGGSGDGGGGGDGGSGGGGD